MKALVIGGTRFFGKRLVQLLLDAGAEVTLLNRGSTPDPFGDRVRRIPGDRRKLDTLPLSGHWDAVYDQVCYDAYEARQACEVFGGRVGHYVFTSSQSVYGPGLGLVEADFDPIHHALKNAVGKDDDYAEAKRQAEAVFFQSKAFPVTALRFPIVLGEDDYTARLAFHVERARQGKPIYFPNLDARISFIHAADAARTLEFVGRREAMGPLNACAGDPISLRECMAIVGRAVGRDVRTTPDPNEGEHSPFGIPSDWTMDAGKLARAGFTARPILDWLPALARTLAR